MSTATYRSHDPLGEVLSKPGKEKAIVILVALRIGYASVLVPQIRRMN